MTCICLHMHMDAHIQCNDCKKVKLQKIYFYTFLNILYIFKIFLKPQLPNKLFTYTVFFKENHFKTYKSVLS